MDRIIHERTKKLTPLRSQSIPAFYTFDVETNGLRARPDAFVFGVIYGPENKPYRTVVDGKEVLQRHKVVYSIEEFKEELLKARYKNKYVFAHNAEYDCTTIFGNIFDLDQNAIFNGRFIFATNGNAKFADSLNIFPTSLKKLGELIGLEKMDISDTFINGTVPKNLFTYRGSKKNKKRKKVSEHMIKYCIRDCEIAHVALTQVFEETGFLAITQASLSMKLFRSRYFPRKLIYSEEAVEKFRPSYFGGRTEAFRLGKMPRKGAYVYDINSMYPDAMMNAKFPDITRLRTFKDFDNEPHIIPFEDSTGDVRLKYRIDNGLDMFMLMLKGNEGVVHCLVEHKEARFPCLPVLMEIEKETKLVFPTGIFTGHWNFNEMRYALASGLVEILEVYEFTCGPSITSPFQKFVSDLYERRKKSTNEFEKYRLKIFMNSLYGKFAEYRTEETLFFPDIEKKEFFDAYAKYEKEGNLLRVLSASIELQNRGVRWGFMFIKTDEKKDWSIPAYASYITSYARTKLLSYLHQYEEFDPVYCDTDSIFFSKKPSIKDSNELGEWKQENKRVLEVIGLKMYVYEDANGNTYERLKGVPTKAQKQKDGRYKYKSMIRTKESFRRQKDAGIFEVRYKELSYKYSKRKLLENGDTKAIRL